MFTSACASYPPGTHEDDSCLQIAHQLKQFLTMLPSQYFDKFVYKKRHFDRNQVFTCPISHNLLFLFCIFCLKASLNRLSAGLRAGAGA
jgi:hypothetical protein